VPFPFSLNRPVLRLFRACIRQAEIEAKKRAEKEFAKRRERQREYEDENGVSGGRRLGDGAAMPKGSPRPRPSSGYNPLTGGGGGGGGGGFRPSARPAPGGGG